jgi:hypothetical protein
MEGRALAQFTSPKGPLSDLGRSSSVTVPGLLYYCREEHVLVFEDLGTLLTLFEYLAAIPNENTFTSISAQEPCQKIGLRIGEFFARLHSPNSLEQVSISTSGDLQNNLVKDLVLQAAVMTIEDYLTRFDIPGVHKLFSRVLADYQRDDLPLERCFALGDFTPGAVLLAVSGDGDQPIGVIDWEFSGVGRGPNGDMSQFLASLHLLLMAASPGSQRQSAIESLIQGVCSAYRQHSSKWLPQPHLKMPTGWGATQGGLEAPLENLQVFRSALILHGREMINNAVQREWPGSTQKECSVLIQEMVRKGAWYIERAGDNVKEMLDTMNVEQLLQEGGGIMLRLFGVED